VGDVVPALVRLIESDTATGDAFNLGGAEEVSINDLAERVIRVTGSSSSIVHVDYADAYSAGFEDMRRRVPDYSKAARLVGFDPATPLDEIIKRVATEISLRRRRSEVPAYIREAALRGATL
jgi:UDP-glucose 4-epimerase